MIKDVDRLLLNILQDASRRDALTGLDIGPYRPKRSKHRNAKQTKARKRGKNKRP